MNTQRKANDDLLTPSVIGESLQQMGVRKTVVNPDFTVEVVREGDSYSAIETKVVTKSDMLSWRGYSSIVNKKGTEEMKSKILKVGLKSAPWIFVAWLAANFASCLYPPVDGFCRYLPLGPVKIDTWLTAVPACGLFLIWVQKKLPMPAVWYWASITLGLLVCVAMSVLENPNRAMRVVALIMGQEIG